MLQIYNASAGSGKTFSLVRDYLLLALNRHFCNILAVTFTNNAAIEMKNRIINELITINKGQHNKIFEELSDKYQNIDKNALKYLLKSILHNYSDFNISTIDSFVSKVVRSFAFDLRLNANFEIEMDTDYVSKHAVNSLMEQITDNKYIYSYIKEYIFQNLDEQKSWDIRSSLEDFASILFKEKTNEILASMKIDDEHFANAISTLRQNCFKIVSFYNQEIEKIITEAEKFSQNIENSRLYGVIKTFIANKNLKDFFGKKSILELLENNNIKSTNIANFANLCVKPLWQIYNNADFKIAKRILKSVYNFGLINELNKILIDFRQSNNSLFMIDLTLILKKMVEEIDAPFIYERIGSRVTNIMIDEFQDTSDFQWTNFVPIVQNTLAVQDHQSDIDKSIIVGDVKQSIYRWRNGNWKLLHLIIHNQFRGWISTQNLDTNYRSLQNIVLFNNALFQTEAIPNIFYEIAKDKINKKIRNLEFIREIYALSEQKPAANKEGGFVNIGFIPTTNYNNFALEWLKKTLIRILNLDDYNDLYENSLYKPSDICIITRTNAESYEVVQLLLDINLNLPPQKRFGIISQESLNIQNSTAVNLIINTLKMFYFLSDTNTPNKHLLLLIARDYNSLILKTLEDENLFKLQIDQIIEILPPELIELAEEYTNMSLIELVEKIIQIFKINQSATREEIAFLRTLEEIVIEFEAKHSSVLSKFLEFWENKGKQRYVFLSRQENSINVMTIHKSKGLTFNVVILPFVSWDIMPKSHQMIWIENSKYSFIPKELKYIPVELGSVDQFCDDKDFEEFADTLIDNLNLLYVAMTRAVYAIYVLSSYTKTQTNNNIGDVLKSSISLISDKIDFTKSYETIEISNQSNEEVDSNETNKSVEIENFNFGTEKPIRQKSQENSNKFFELEFFPSYDWRDNISIVSHSEDFVAETIEKRRLALKIGLVVHKILENTVDLANIDNQINNFCEKLGASEEERKEIKYLLSQITENQQFRSWFEEVKNIFVEKEILTKSGKTYRPDRVIEKADEIIIIDYKTGQKRYSDKKQIKEYASMLQQIYPSHRIISYLFYITDNEIVEV